MRDKLGNEIEVGDTLICSDSDGLHFREVTGFEHFPVDCAGTSMEYMITEDLDGNEAYIHKPYCYVSLCAAKREARAALSKELENGCKGWCGALAEALEGLRSSPDRQG
jgi:hypothetical protein